MCVGKGREPEVKVPASAESQKRQGSHSKTSPSASLTSVGREQLSQEDSLTPRFVNNS